MKSYVKVAALLLAGSGLSGGCGGSDSGPPKIAPGGTADQTKWPADDRSLCKWKNVPDLDVVELPGHGSTRPNIRRVYRILGEGDAKQKTLICREVDTNLDGIKDLVRTFNAKGEALREEQDTDFDGKMDVWIDFSNNRIARVEIDTRKSGRPNVWKYYTDGRVARVQRNLRCASGKPDTWEIYVGGRLDRIGTDTNCDGTVDRWDKDLVRMRQVEEEQKKAEEAAERAKKAASAPDGGTPSDTPTADPSAAPAHSAKPAAPRDAGVPGKR